MVEVVLEHLDDETTSLLGARTSIHVQEAQPETG